MGKRKGRVIRTAYTKKDQFLDTAESFVVYMEVTKASRAYLKSTGRYHKGIDVRMQVEAGFCLTALLNLFKLDINWIRRIVKAVRSDKKKFREYVEKFSNHVVPLGDKPQLYNLEDLKQEIMGTEKRKETQKKIVDPSKFGGLIK